MKPIGIALLASALMVLAGCSPDSTMDNPVATSSLDKTNAATAIVFQYFGYSRDRHVVVRGTLALSVSPAGRVAGRWELRGVDPSRIGPQVGNGTLTGTLANGVLSINLNPENADNNILLSGRFSRTAYSGQ